MGLQEPFGEATGTFGYTAMASATLNVAGNAPCIDVPEFWRF